MRSLHDGPHVPLLARACEVAHIALQHAGRPARASPGSGTMTTLANLVGFRSQSHTPLLAHIAGRLSVAVRRAAAGRYAEQRERIVRTGGAGMI
jgi:hypothetical protein